MSLRILAERAREKQELIRKFETLHHVVYKDPIDGEPFEEKDGLILDSGGFCEIVKDETTLSSQKIIRLSNLNGTHVLSFPFIPLEALLAIDQQNDKRYVIINETLCDANILAKLLRAIGFHNVQFYQSHEKGLIGIKTTDDHATRQGVIAPLKRLPYEKETKGDAGEPKVRILTLKEVISRYDPDPGCLRFSLQDRIDFRKEPERIERICKQ